jgi:isocitrate/isopropylmalate dehydrogenase
MTHATHNAPTRLVVLQGDGIGPEITAATLHVLAAADRLLDLGLSFTDAPIGLPR